MSYDLYINNEVVGNALSYGELNQWLLDLDAELAGDNMDKFRRDLGAKPGENFEDYLYSNTVNVPFKVMHNKDIIIISENDF